MQQTIILLSIKKFIAINAKDAFIWIVRHQLDHAIYNKMTHQNLVKMTHDNDEIRFLSLCISFFVDTFLNKSKINFLNYR